MTHHHFLSLRQLSLTQQLTANLKFYSCHEKRSTVDGKSHIEGTHSCDNWRDIFLIPFLPLGWEKRKNLVIGETTFTMGMVLAWDRFWKPPPTRQNESGFCLCVAGRLLPAMEPLKFYWYYDLIGYKEKVFIWWTFSR